MNLYIKDLKIIKTTLTVKEIKINNKITGSIFMFLCLEQME